MGGKQKLCFLIQKSTKIWFPNRSLTIELLRWIGENYEKNKRKGDYIAK
jgi:hypothetical protein